MVGEFYYANAQSKNSKSEEENNTKTGEIDSKDTPKT